MKACLAIVLLTASVATSFAQSSPAASYFQFTTDDFWLNLHHYLYVLGRAHNGAPDSTEPAVASAPDDEKQGLALLTDEERRSWTAAVDAYSKGLSQQASMFQLPLAAMTTRLAKTGDVTTFPVSTIAAPDRATLEMAAPIYRKAWWPAHRAMNEQYLADLQRAIERDGPSLVRVLSRVYGLEWPVRPYPTHVVKYAMWGGAFSFTGRMMILSSNPNAQNTGWSPLEGVFHEAMHQWDEQWMAVLRAQAVTRGVTVPQDLSHALIFYTVGDAVRRLHPEHVPMVDALDIWQKPLSGARVPAKRLQPIIQQIWKPYLDGRGSRDDTVAALVVAAAAATP
jgi:hypothetical protein